VHWKARHQHNCKRRDAIGREGQQGEPLRPWQQPEDTSLLPLALSLSLSGKQTAGDHAINNCRPLNV